MRRSIGLLLFSKPITQGYTSQLPPPPPSAQASGRSWMRAADRNTEVRQYYHMASSHPNYRNDSFEGYTSEAADYEAYEKWYAEMYPDGSMEDGKVLEDQRTQYDLEGVEEEMQFWKEEFSHRTFVK